MKKVYISGSSGMVGRNIIEKLNLQKFEIITSNSSELNLLDYNAVKCFLKSVSPDYIVHCAGKVGGIQANIKDSYGFFVENMYMGLNLISAAKEAGVKNFLNISSSCSYPYNAPNPLSEDLVFAGKLEPTNEGYAIAKASLTRLCEFVSRQFAEYNYKTIIPCNLYGKYDKFDDSNSHMIPAVIKKIHNAKANGIKQIEIWGDGLARREFMFVSDLAIMVNKILSDFENMPNTMNVGLGYDYTINEYYEIIAKVIGYKGEFIHDLSKPAGMKQKLLDIKKQLSYGLKAQFSLEEGIRQTYDYYLINYKGE